LIFGFVGFVAGTLAALLLTMSGKILIGLFVAFGIAFGIWGFIVEIKEDNAEAVRNNERISKLKLLTYSEENYEKLKELE
jgi:hypothetical protein